MRKKISGLLLISVKFSAAIAQSNVGNQNLKKDSNTIYRNVKTETIDVGGTTFHYRELGGITACP